MKKRIIIPAAVLLLFVTYFYVINKENTNIYKYSRMLLGTIVNISIISDSEDKAENASENAFREIKRIESLMSSYLDGSDITNITNNAFSKPVVVSEETFNIIKKSIGVSMATDGSFDITFKSLSKIWNFKGDKFTIPDKRQIEKYLSFVNYRHINLNEKKSSVKISKKETKIGLGGIAKGYAVGRGIKILESNGIQNSIVEAGGDLQVIGSKDGKPWSIGVQHPRKDALILGIDLSNLDSIATSGDYEQFFIHNNKRYHHIIDPKTGFPAETAASVSVISKNPVDSDAFATAFFVMGKEKAIKLLRKRDDLLVIFIDLNINISASKELRERITFLNAEINKSDVEWF